MKLFGEYLIEKKLINEDALVSALLEQQKKLPSIAEAISDQKIISSKELLSIFKAQSEKRCGFSDAANALGLWKAEWANSVETYVSKKRIPLGQILVAQGALALEQLTKALDEFLSDCNDDIKSTASSQSGSQAGASAYADAITADLKKQLEQVFTKPASGPYDSKVLTLARDIIHALRGAAKLSGLKNSEDLLFTMDEFLSDLIKKDLSGMHSTHVDKLEVAGQKFTKVLFAVSELIKAGKSDEESISPDDMNKSFLDAKVEIELLKFDLGFLSEKQGA